MGHGNAIAKSHYNPVSKKVISKECFYVQQKTLKNVINVAFWSHDRHDWRFYTQNKKSVEVGQISSKNE